MLYVTDYTYRFSKDAKPIGRVSSGDILKVKTVDCFCEQIKKEEDTVEHVDWERVNPATGPIYIEDAEPGDVLAVDILNIELNNQGVVCTIPECGPFADKSEIRTSVIRVEDGFIKYKDLSWQIRPMIGVIGVAPEGEEISTGYVGNHGGNMDNPDIVAGTTVWLPVRAKGALLALGDLHATMAEGEVIGVGIEISGEVILRVRLVKSFELNWPIVETDDMFYVSTCGSTCDDAIKAGYLEMHRLIMKSYGWDYTDAGMYMTMRGQLRANQACLVDEAGGDSFRIGTPKLPDKRIIG